MLKRNVVLWMMLGSLLLTPMAGCQREESTVTDSSAMAVVSKDSSLPEEVSSFEPVSSAEPVSSKDTSSEVQSVSSQAVSTMESNEISSQVSQTLSTETVSSYTYSDKVAETVDPSNFKDTITVVLTPEASDSEKRYSASDFPGCDITVTQQGSYGGNLVEYNVETKQEIHSPIYVYLQLKINSSEFEDYQKIVQYFDQREDVAEIWLVPHTIPD